VRGEVEKDEAVLVIRRIHVVYRLKASTEREEAIRRAFEIHPPSCPVYRTLSGCIDVTMELDLDPT
jgi:uncharacterized OsmC-like protein